MSDDEILEPENGAGISPNDPDQSGVSQDPETVIVGDVEIMPTVSA